MYRGLNTALPLLMVLLAGCAGQGTQEPAQRSWMEHSARLREFSHWSASGKLALRTSDRAESASIQWQQRGTDTHLQLSGPMGLNATTIHSNGRQMELRQGETVRTWDISTPDAIANSTGWDLPLHALPYWLKGLPSPDTGIQALELDPERAVLRKLRQDDWEIEFEFYDQFEGFRLPTRLQIQRGTTRARMIIREWQTLPG